MTAFGNGVGAATQPGFTPAAGGHVVAPVGAGGRRRGRLGHAGRAGLERLVPRAADRQGLVLALGGLVVPALFLAWGARPACRRTRRRA